MSKASLTPSASTIPVATTNSSTWAGVLKNIIQSKKGANGHFFRRYDIGGNGRGGLTFATASNKYRILLYFAVQPTLLALLLLNHTDSVAREQNSSRHRAQALSVKSCQLEDYKCRTGTSFYSIQTTPRSFRFGPCGRVVSRSLQQHTWNAHSGSSGKILSSNGSEAPWSSGVAARSTANGGLLCLPTPVAKTVLDTMGDNRPVAQQVGATAAATAAAAADSANLRAVPLLIAILNSATCEPGNRPLLCRLFCVPERCCELPLPVTPRSAGATTCSEFLKKLFGSLSREPNHNAAPRG